MAVSPEEQAWIDKATQLYADADKYDATARATSSKRFQAAMHQCAQAARTLGDAYLRAGRSLPPQPVKANTKKKA